MSKTRNQNQTSSAQDVNEIAKAAAMEAIRQYKEEEKKQQKKAILHNTRVLLNHYTSLKEHYDNAKYRAEDIISVEIDDRHVNIKRTDGEEIFIESIKRSRVVTLIMISHIDTCMDLLRAKMNRKKQPEKFEALKMLYIDKEISKQEWQQRLQYIAETLHISESTLRRWEKEMVDELSVFLFGAGGLKIPL